LINLQKTKPTIFKNKKGKEMELVLDQKEMLKDIFREIIKEVIQEEKISFYDSIFPLANNKESKDLETMYENPNSYQKSDFKDMTDWVLNENLIP
jgi:hypothetical protein